MGLIVDLFAGGGGASTGLAWALGRDPDIAINHDAQALSMHAANHPKTRHLLNDITRILPLEATRGRPVDVLHASPDCTHFSKAKGGKPKSQHIRDLAWVVIRWAEDTHPNLITLENVEEFLTWGPLNKDGQPIKEQAGSTFAAWRQRLVRLGYRVEWRLLRACDYGAPTTRRRLFVVARRDKRPIVWPVPTHGNPKSAAVLAGKLLPWRTAAECIDWKIGSQSIFNRKKPLASNTQRRIAEGLRRYVFQSPEPFIVTYYGAKKPGDFRGLDLKRPLPTQTTENRFSLISPVVVTNTTGHAPNSVDAPLPTLTTGNQQIVAGAIIHPNHVAPGYTPFRGQNVAEPLRSITQSPGFALAELKAVSFLSRQFGRSVGQGVNTPHPTITQSNHDMVVSAACMVKYYGNEQGGVPVTDPLHTITSKDRMGLVTAHLEGVDDRAAETRAWLREREVIGPDDDAVICHAGQNYRIFDICMRMLAPRELYAAQGFPRSYIIDDLPDGTRLTKTAQVRMCGNSVPPQLVAALVRANGPSTWATPRPRIFPMLDWMLQTQADRIPCLASS
ncbi:DNA cytosine methyltransferase [uncultured Desulfovibrio sp.]|uniref:DNA cytosine methyltransferase n=1 Tax=uncultured Desulfovibrio sp. TaxID=167968 RepID=UPI00272CCA48|nr:DNA cytosine methyltransferase [uncultured Desulfovibrio sp.]